MDIILDFDDTLCPCTEVALQMAGIDYDPDNIQWNLAGHTAEERDRFFHVFETQEFYDAQQPYEGAQEMVQTLVDAGHNVSIYSSVKPHLMKFRAEQAMRLFPMVKDNIILGKNKHLMAADIILDDAAHNVLVSRAKNRVLIRRSWNKNEKGVLSVSSYEEFLALVKQVNGRASSNNQPPFIAFVGPSGSGKSSILERLTKMDIRFSLLASTTTRAPRSTDLPGEYSYMEKGDFVPSDFIEWTEYAGNYYGTKEADVAWIQGKGMIPVRAMDIKGALAMKSRYPDAVILFVYRKKEDAIRSLLERNESIDQKVRRITSMDEEYRLEGLCDQTVVNQGDLDNVVKRIIEMF